jgi:hypothetical protein
VSPSPPPQVCDTSGCNPDSCGDAARDVLLRIGNTGTITQPGLVGAQNTSDTGDGILTFSGPQIEYIYGKTSGNDNIGYAINPPPTRALRQFSLLSGSGRGSASAGFG